MYRWCCGSNVHLSIYLYTIIYICNPVRSSCTARSFLGSILECGCDDGVLVLGHPHQCWLHRVVVLQRFPAAAKSKPSELSAAADGCMGKHSPAMAATSAAYSLPVSADEVVDEDADLQLCQAHPGAHPWPAPEPQEAVRLERFLRERTWHQHTLQSARFRRQA